MSKLFVTLAVLVIIHNDLTFGFCRHSRRYNRNLGYTPESRHGRCRTRFPQNHEADKVTEIVKKYTEADGTLGTFCRSNTIVPKITYSTTAYVIMYNLTETKDMNVTVTIKKQTLATKITETGAFKSFSDVRVLPDILKLSEAMWSFQNTDLKILIPYKVPLGTEFVAECTPGSESIEDIVVPNPPALNVYFR